MHDDSQGLARQSSDLILQFGEQLAAQQTYEEQERWLIAFLKEQFQADSQIWLKPSTKFQLTKSRDEKAVLPIAPDSFDLHAKLAEEGFCTLQTDHSNWVILPLVYGSLDMGLILLNREEAFTNDQLQNLKHISQVTSFAIFATQQTQLNLWRQKQLALVRSVSEQISQITDLQTLSSQITELVQQTFDYSYVAIFLINEEDGRLYFKASALADDHSEKDIRRPEFELQTHPGFAMGEHIIGHVASTGEELIANDVKSEPRYKQVDSLSNTRSEAVLPLEMENKIFGVFDVQSDQLNAFDENDLVVLHALADNIAIAIESTRLMQNIQQRADQLAAVGEVIRAITVILDTDELLRKITNLIRERFEFPYVHLFVVDPVQNLLTYRAGSGERSAYYKENAISYDLDSEKGILVWVVRNRQTKRINDVSDEPLFFLPENAPKVGSEMSIPLIFGKDTLGVLDIQSDQVNAFSSDNQRLMETLADNVAIAIRNARLYRSERWRRQVAESLRDVAGMLSDNTDLLKVLNEILEQLHITLPCDIASIWLFDNTEGKPELPVESRKLVLAAAKGSSDYPSSTLGNLNFYPDAWLKNALLSTDPAIRKEEDPLGPIAQHFHLPTNYSSIAVPLYTGNELLGMLTLDHHTAGRYGTETQRITSAFASYAAVAIKNTRLYNKAQEQAWIATLLLQVATATQSLTNLDELVTTIVRLTPMVAGIKACTLFLKENGENNFSLYAAYGIAGFGENIVLEQPIRVENAPILERLIVEQDILMVKDPAVDFNLPGVLPEIGSEDTMILLPLSAREETLGALLVINENENTLFTPTSTGISDERLKIIQGITQQTAVAMENILLLEAKQEEAYVSTVLLQSAQAAVSSADLQDTLDSIVNIMPILVGIDASVIYLWDKDEAVFRTAHAATKGITKDQPLIGLTYTKGDFPMLDAVYQNNHPVVFPFTETTLPPEDWDLALPDEGQVDPTPVLNSRYPLLMGFPLSMQDEVFGVLLAQEISYRTNRQRRYELIMGMAQQASLAIQNDRLQKEMIERQHLEREFQLARQIQQTFLPEQKLQIPNWDMDVYWETARQVGGDFYDYFLLPDGRLAFVIADVSDKGLAASLYMTVTRTLLRAAALESDSPARTLEHVNELLLANSQNGLFVTTFYGILSLEEGLLTYAIAGHNPPILLRHHNHEVIEFSKGGIALGALPNIHLTQNQVILDPGDCLVLYTDGITEAFNAQDQMFGEQRLMETLKSVIGENAHIVISHLITKIADFRGNSPLSDDTTVLTICRSLS